MARPLSEQKRDAILKAAAQIVSLEGLGASTARIARAAGVADGTLFTYFATKDALFNGLYAAIKRNLADALLDGYPRAQPARARLRHVWDNYVRWGLAHQLELGALSQLSTSTVITPAVLRDTKAYLAEVETLLRDCSDATVHPASGFTAALMTVMAETTIKFMAAEPTRADLYAEAGFGAYCRAIAAAL